jgi:hypothetical protein
MKRTCVSIILLALSIAGCDVWYWRRIDITPRTDTTFTINSSSSITLIEAVRKFAAELELYCPESNQLPFECFKQPTHVWVMLTKQGATVCFYAIGAPFETSKFEKRMARLESILASTFGAASVSSQPTQCPAVTTTPNQALHPTKNRAAVLGG